jgi:hypothetical protein
LERLLRLGHAEVEGEAQAFLRDDAGVAALFTKPEIRELLQDSSFMEQIDAEQVGRWIQDRRVVELMKDHDFVSKLESIDLGQLERHLRNSVFEPRSASEGEDPTDVPPRQNFGRDASGP